MRKTKKAYYFVVHDSANAKTIRMFVNKPSKLKGYHEIFRCKSLKDAESLRIKIQSEIFGVGY